MVLFGGRKKIRIRWISQLNVTQGWWITGDGMSSALISTPLPHRQSDQVQQSGEKQIHSLLHSYGHPLVPTLLSVVSRSPTNACLHHFPSLHSLSFRRSPRLEPPPGMVSLIDAQRDSMSSPTPPPCPPFTLVSSLPPSIAPQSLPEVD